LEESSIPCKQGLAGKSWLKKRLPPFAAAKADAFAFKASAIPACCPASD